MRPHARGPHVLALSPRHNARRNDRALIKSHSRAPPSLPSYDLRDDRAFCLSCEEERLAALARAAAGGGGAPHPPAVDDADMNPE